MSSCPGAMGWNVPNGKQQAFAQLWELWQDTVSLNSSQFHFWPDHRHSHSCGRSIKVSLPDYSLWNWWGAGWHLYSATPLATSAAHVHFMATSCCKSLHNKMPRWLYTERSGHTMETIFQGTPSCTWQCLKLPLEYKNTIISKTRVCSLCSSRAAVLEKHSLQTVRHPWGTQSNQNNATWKFVYMVLFPLQGHLSLRKGHNSIMHFFAVSPHSHFTALFFFCKD